MFTIFLHGRKWGWLGGMAWSLFAAGLVFAQANDSKLPPFSAVRQTVESHFATDRDRTSGDLLSRSEVTQVFRLIEQLGWEVEDQPAIVKKALPDHHVLIVTFRSPAGRRFMRQISDRPLMYDRLDRLSSVSGGSRLIQDLVKLPDAERYAKPQSGGGVPDLLDLLPKNASGQTRQIPNYHKPTGNLYTVGDLLTLLAESHRHAIQAVGNPKPGTN